MIKRCQSIYLYVMIASILITACSRQQPSTDETRYEVTSPISVTDPEVAFTESEETSINPTEHIELTGVEPGSYQLRYEDDSSKDYMDYYLYIPNNPQKDMPIVVFLHGAVEIGHVELLQDYGIVSVTKELYGGDFPFLLLLPCTHLSSWTTGSVPETLVGLIDSVVNTYEADPDRIILTGHSLGAVGTWNMISLYADYFSAAVPVSCGIDEKMNYENCAKVPIKAFSGTIGNDEKNYNPAMHTLVSRINDAGGNATMVAIEGADHEDMVTAAYTTELFDWMLEQ